jgi:hypothetical protein
MRITERSIRRIIREILDEDTKPPSAPTGPRDPDTPKTAGEGPSAPKAPTVEGDDDPEDVGELDETEDLDEEDLDEECASDSSGAAGTYSKGADQYRTQSYPTLEQRRRRPARLTSRQIRRIIREELKLDIEKGDVILTGKFKNKRTVVKDFGTDDLGQPTINGMKALKFRIEKLMPKEKWSKKTQQEAEEAGLDEVRRVIRRELRK